MYVMHSIVRPIALILVPQTVKLPKKWGGLQKRIHSPEDPARILALIEASNLLICKTCLETGTRISEVTGEGAQNRVNVG